MGDLIDLETRETITNTATINPSQHADSDKSGYNKNKEEIAVSRSGGGDDGMNGDDYIKRREFENAISSLNQKIDLRFDNIDEKFKTVDEKFGRISDKIESNKKETISEVKDYIYTQHQKSVQWNVGTAIAAVGVIIAAIKLFM